MNELSDQSSPLVVGNASRDFLPRSDLTYRSYETENLISIDLSRSLLIGTFFQRCTFKEVTFDNCDIEGARFLECAFENCSFVDADIRSCNFSRCKIEWCHFDQALLMDLSIQDTAFASTSFERASIHDSVFENSTLLECSLKHASALHNRFEAVSFEGMRIAECTFLYALMVDCQFQRVQLNAEAVGTIFGIAREDLESMELIYLGEVQRNPVDDIVSALKCSYFERKWEFLTAMLAVNYGPATRLLALNQAIDALSKVAVNGIGVKRDEFRFLANVSEKLSQQGKLPVGFLVHAAEQTGQVLNRPNLATSSSNTVQELHNKLFLLLQESLDLYQASIGMLIPTEDLSTPVLMTLTYRERPETDSDQMVRLAGESISSIEPISATLISARPGSWIELVQTTALGALALYALLVATNGVLAQIIRTRALATALIQPIPKRTVQTLVRNTVLTSDKQLQSPMARTALNALSDLAKRATTHTEVAHHTVGTDLEKLQYILVEADKGKDSR